jgi:hypothetical protein
MKYSIKILALASLAVCSLSADAKAYTQKQNSCYQVTGFCTVSCDLGTVVVGGGCYNNSNSVGISASFPGSDRQWVCRPASKSQRVDVFAICQ